MSVLGRDLYAIIAVDRACTMEELRAAYRERARQLHPDVSGVDDGGRSMADLNEAWRCLSNPELREAYDAELVQAQPVPIPVATGLSRRDAWVIGVQAQIGRLGRLAGRSATQTLLLRSSRASRSHYDELVLMVVEELMLDTVARVRAARAAGSAPLDLGVAAALIGVRTLADRIRRQASLGITTELVMTAELLDRMWDILAHELPNSLEVALGSNPQVTRGLTSLD